MSFRSLWLFILSLAFVSAAPVQAQTAPVTAPATAPSTTSAPATASGASSAPDAYRLGSGDKVRLTVYNEDTLSGEYEVDGSGNLSIQLVGAVPVAGKTVPEVIDLITNTLKAGGYMLNPLVAMEVLNYRPYFVLGEVKTSGKYPYISDMTVLNAIAQAGGYTYRANKSHVMIRRASDPKKEEVEAKPNDLIKPGDTIRIPERFF